MAAALFDNPLFPLFHDPELSQLFSAEHTLSLYGEVERALTRAAAAEGVVARGAAEHVLETLDRFTPTSESLADASHRDGIPLPGYVGALKVEVGAEHSSAAHPGSTSQDIMDTALALALRQANTVMAVRLAEIVSRLGRLEARFGSAPLMGRTRMQAALPVTIAHRISMWRAPLLRQQDRYGAAREDVERLQFGGAVGTRVGWEGRANEIAARMAAELSLREPGAAWHVGRDGLATYASWLSVTSAALGKIGQDVVLMAQQGFGEVAIAGAGGSSAMPHKQNPVAAEALVTLARFSATQVSAMHHAVVAEQERSGTAWALEWLTLPQLVLSTGVGLRVCHDLLGAVTRLGSAGGDAQ